MGRNRKHVIDKENRGTSHDVRERPPINQRGQPPPPGPSDAHPTQCVQATLEPRNQGTGNRNGTMSDSPAHARRGIPTKPPSATTCPHWQANALTREPFGREQGPLIVASTSPSPERELLRQSMIAAAAHAKQDAAARQEGSSGRSGSVSEVAPVINTNTSARRSAAARP